MKSTKITKSKNILNYPEYQDIDQAKKFLALLETKDTLYDVLADGSDMEFTIRIGKENSIPELRNMSVITATYRISNEKMGTFGVIGPTRMNYARILSVLKQMSNSLQMMLQFPQAFQDA